MMGADSGDGEREWRRVDPALALPAEIFVRVLQTMGTSLVNTGTHATLYDGGYPHVRESRRKKRESDVVTDSHAASAVRKGKGRAIHRDAAQGSQADGDESTVLKPHITPTTPLRRSARLDPTSASTSDEEARRAYEPWDVPPIPETTFDAVSLLRCSWVSRAWRAFATEKVLWSALCDMLWEGKVFVPEKFRELRDSDPRRAYVESLIDSRRFIITKEELLFLPWHFRFKSSAGEHFTDEDPWWNHLPPRVRRFLPDHTIEGLAVPGWKWRFVDTSGGVRGPRGAFVRVGRTPASVLSRHRWVFKLETEPSGV
ncbi:hypothetical protein M427DRAFT_467474 [Gonapodya prolifera JEL478]|uniref:F-box domain-containing protein n=1 Tax=Gonapodya prolifera (strain JEL478) TaxID=1344416 RepID=A0A139A1F4_GONPJ|nr:hypothetical protein M427DRAFT_467474 [Gonapodya prolifera JEL478]|eukprot:KXS10617.1 hypothetical protein M427DRAFT_467474 [Gonapodya prolifera JEL478]